MKTTTRLAAAALATALCGCAATPDDGYAYGRNPAKPVVCIHPERPYWDQDAERWFCRDSRDHMRRVEGEGDGM